MAETLTRKTTEMSGGVTANIPLHEDGTYDWPVVQLVPTELGGCSVSRTLSAGTVNATIVKSTAGQLYGYSVTNINAVARFLKIYNKATAPAETDTPVMTIPVKAGSGTAIEVVSEQFTNGLAFSNGIGFRITGLLADNDTTAVSPNEHVITLYYK